MQLAVQSGAEAGKVFEIDRPLMVIGRQVGNEIQINDGQVSRRHCQLENRDGNLYLTDLGSANGTYLNEHRLTPNQAELFPTNAVLRVGDTSFVLQGLMAAPQGNAGTAATLANNAVMGISPQNYAQVPNAPTPESYYPNQAVGFDQGPVQAPVQNNFQAAGQSFDNSNFANQNQAYPATANSNPKGAERSNGLWFGLGALVLVLVAGIGGFLVLGNSANKPNSEANTNSSSSSNSTTVVAGANLTATPGLVQTTLARGSSGSNPPPPTPALASLSTKATSTPLPASNSNLVPVKGLGVTIAFPKSWKSQLDTAKQQIVGIASDNITFVLVLQTDKISGSVLERANTGLSNIKSDHSDLKVTVQPKASSDGSIAVCEYDYTDTDTDTLTHERMYAIQGQPDSTITYYIFFSSSKEVFSSQESTFNTIENSFNFSS
jgi:pSer/pThr/pTyr-binding forkhead associated (FHA) protein